MPSLYQGICRHCGHTSDLMPASYGAVWVDAPVRGSESQVAATVVQSDGGPGAAADDRHLVILAHPSESRILASTGYRWSDLFWQGRYVLARNVVCRRCGHLFTKRQLSAPGAAGCLPSVVVGAAIGIAVGCTWGRVAAGIITGLGVSFAGCVLVDFAAALYVRWRYAQRAASLASEVTCPACGADDSVVIHNRLVVVCPACRQAEMRFEMAGKS